MRSTTLWVIVLFALMLALATGAPAAAQGCEDCKIIKEGLRGATPGAAAPAATAAAPVARVVLFWAEGCGYCHEVLDGVLPALQQQYHQQLEVRLVEVVTMEDIAAFFDVAEAHGFDRGQASVPFLLIGDRALMGVEQISAELPGLLEASLASGGTDWPSLARKSAALAAPAADDACGFDVPCEEDAGAAISAAADDPATDAAPAIGNSGIAVGLAAFIGAGLAGFVLLRARSRRAQEAEPFADVLQEPQGDSDAS